MGLVCLSVLGNLLILFLKQYPLPQPKLDCLEDTQGEMDMEITYHICRLSLLNTKWIHAIMWLIGAISTALQHSSHLTMSSYDLFAWNQEGFQPGLYRSGLCLVPATLIA